MSRVRCPGCGAAVDVAKIKGTDDTVPLDIHPDTSSNVDRYRIVELNPLTVEMVRKGAVGDYLSDHRFDCPAHGAGRGVGGL